MWLIYYVRGVFQKGTDVRIWVFISLNIIACLPFIHLKGNNATFLFYVWLFFQFWSILPLQFGRKVCYNTQGKKHKKKTYNIDSIVHMLQIQLQKHRYLFCKIVFFFQEMQGVVKRSLYHPIEQLVKTLSAWKLFMLKNVT